jgi:hypothetical protein
VLSSCSGDDGSTSLSGPPPGEGVIEARVSNTTTFDFKSVRLEFSSDPPVDFGSALNGVVTDHKSVPREYAKLHVEYWDGTTVELEPWLNQSDVLTSARYTYRIAYTCDRGLRVYVSEDDPLGPTSDILTTVGFYWNQSDTVTQGEDAHVYASVKNQTSRTIEVPLNFELPPPVALILSNEDGTVVDLPYPCVRHGDSVWRIPPDFQQGYWWSLSTAGLAPGRYTVKCGIIEHQDEYPWGSVVLTVQ